MAGRAADFGGRVARMMSIMLRELSRRQMFETVSRSKLTVSQILVIELLRDGGPSRMGDLAKELNLTMSAVTGIVDKMIKLGLASRMPSKEDRRVVNVRLLKRGLDLAEKILEEREKAVQKLFSVLTEKEKAEYLRLIGKVFTDLVREK